MSKASPIQTSFNAGELSPALEGRVDLGKYASGCKKLENFIPMVQGPIRRRSGTRFVEEVKNSANRTWLIRFEFNETQAYILEFGNLYIRFYTNHGQVLSSGSAYEIASPYTTADLTNDNDSLRLRFVQSGDVVYFVHPSYSPRKLSRFGATNWTLTEVDFEGGPFEDVDPDQTTTVYSSAATGTVTITSSASLFTAADIGNRLLIEAKDGGDIVPWESQKDFGVNVNPFNERRRSDGKIYICKTNVTPASGQAVYTGSTRPTHIEGVYRDGFGTITGTSLDGSIGVDWQYESLDYGIVKITGYTSATQVTGTVELTLPFNVVYTPAGSAQNITSIAATGSSQVRVTLAGHGYSNGDTINVSINADYDFILQNNSVACGGPGGTTTSSQNKNTAGTYGIYVIDSATFDVLGLAFPSTKDINYTYLDDPGSGCVNIDATSTGTYDAFTAGTVQLLVSGTTSNITPRFAFSRWSASRGYPSQVTFFRERLVFATKQTIDMSVAADFENFSDRNTSGEVAPDMAIAIDVSSDTVNTIEWLSPSDGLLIGTAGGEFVAGEVTTDAPLGPGNVKITQQSLFGSRSVIPSQIGDLVLFVQRSGKKIRELQYDFNSNGYKSNDVTVLAEHITNGGIVDIAYQQEPHSILWAARADGVLLGFTYNREQDVLGWHRHILGGNGIVECVEHIPNPNGTQDDIWLIVRRTINGQTKRYIEYLETDFTQDTALSNAFFVDSGLSYNGAATTTLSGLGHLEGKNVQVLVNGAAHPDRVVTSGAITLQTAATTAAVGLGYESTVQTMRIEAGARDGTAQGKTKRINKMVIRFLATVGAVAGPDENNLDRIQFRTGSDLMDQSVPLFTGDKLMEWPSGYDFDGYVVIKQDQPLPMTIVAIMAQLHTMDR